MDTEIDTETVVQVSEMPSAASQLTFPPVLVSLPSRSMQHVKYWLTVQSGSGVGGAIGGGIGGLVGGTVNGLLGGLTGGILRNADVPAEKN